MSKLKVANESPFLTQKTKLDHTPKDPKSNCDHFHSLLNMVLEPCIVKLREGKNIKTRANYPIDFLNKYNNSGIRRTNRTPPPLVLHTTFREHLKVEESSF